MHHGPDARLGIRHGRRHQEARIRQEGRSEEGHEESGGGESGCEARLALFGASSQGDDLGFLPEPQGRTGQIDERRLVLEQRLTGGGAFRR